MLTELYKVYCKHYAVCTDTRQITPNSIFFALKGDNFDGNKYAQQAIENGCAYAVIDNADYKLDDRYFLVDDVLTTLQELAKHHRNQLEIPFIGITGSNGKTTSKELIREVLKQKYTVLATVGNLNNHIGVPLTILSITPDVEIAIIEMGANHQKEIEFLSSISMPDYGFITNFGKAHLEGFGGIEGVIKGKSELYDNLRSRRKTAFINYDDKLQVEKSKGINSISFGTSTDADYTISLKSSTPTLALSWNNISATSNLIGSYNLYNMGAAIAMGKYFEVSDEQIKTALENYLPTNNRSQLHKTSKNELILDAYNANPTSMHQAIVSFSKSSGKKKMAILGDMFELGEYATIEHQTIANLAEELIDGELILVGKNFATVNTTAKQIESTEEVKSYLKKLKPQGFSILVKGSRGMKLEQLTEAL